MHHCPRCTNSSDMAGAKLNELAGVYEDWRIPKVTECFILGNQCTDGLRSSHQLDKRQGYAPWCLGGCRLSGGQRNRRMTKGQEPFRDVRATNNDGLDVAVQEYTPQTQPAPRDVDRTRRNLVRHDDAVRVDRKRYGLPERTTQTRSERSRCGGWYCRCDVGLIACGDCSNARQGSHRAA